jgi:alpha-N-acetylglucosamine transferase
MAFIRKKFCIVVFAVLIYIFYNVLHFLNDREEVDKKFAYVVLNTNIKSLLLTLILFHQLKLRNCNKGEFVVMIPSGIESKVSILLSTLRIKREIYDGGKPLVNPKYNVTNEATKERDKIMWEKLRVWNMTKYEKIILLDNDLLVRENIDNLFEEPSISAVPALYDDEKIIFWDPKDLDNFKKVGRILKGADGLNGGLIVLNPNKHTFEELLTNSEALTNRTCCPFQEFIFRFFEKKGEYHRLPKNYNMRKLIRQKNVNIDEVKVFHFVEKKKPWILGKSLSSQHLMSKEWWEAAENFIKSMQRICNGIKAIAFCEILEEIKKESIQFVTKLIE